MPKFGSLSDLPLFQRLSNAIGEIDSEGFGDRASEFRAFRSYAPLVEVRHALRE